MLFNTTAFKSVVATHLFRKDIHVKNYELTTTTTKRILTKKNNMKNKPTIEFYLCLQYESYIVNTESLSLIALLYFFEIIGAIQVFLFNSLH